MKKIIILIVLICTCAFFIHVDAQIDITKKIRNRAERHANDGIDKGLDEIEKNLFEDDKSESEKSSEQEKTEESKETESTTSETTTSETDQKKEEGSGAAALNWSRYDFIPGDKVIFEDNLQGEENGEFPSRWDLVKGVAENAEVDGENVIYFRSASTSIIPYIKNRDQDYLPEKFTVEFDCYFEKHEYPSYYVTLYDLKNQSYIKLDPVRIIPNGAHCGHEFKGKYPGKGYEYDNENSFWRHVSISFNRRALKVYLDDSRILNIPNIEANPSGITISIDGYGTAGVKGINRFIKNIRIAEGAVKLYDKLQQDGKIVSNGIRFDVGKSTIRPESMGVLNKITELMNDHTDIKFSVEGHTDSDGDEDFNMKLSEERAEAVVNILVQMGIERNRLESKGFGETVPVDTNSTPEGKANNRRVEFIKI